MTGGLLERQRLSGFIEPMHNSLHFQQVFVLYGEHFQQVDSQVSSLKLQPKIQVNVGNYMF